MCFRENDRYIVPDSPAIGSGAYEAKPATEKEKDGQVARPYSTRLRMKQCICTYKGRKNALCVEAGRSTEIEEARDKGCEFTMSWAERDRGAGNEGPELGA